MITVFYSSHRNQFPEIILAAYHYALIQTSKYLKEPLESTGLRPHVTLAVDKSTPHRDTNHAILVLLCMEKGLLYPWMPHQYTQLWKEQRTLKEEGCCRTSFKSGQGESGL